MFLVHRWDCVLRKHRNHLIAACRGDKASSGEAALVMVLPDPQARCLGVAIAVSHPKHGPVVDGLVFGTRASGVSVSAPSEVEG